MKTIPTDSLKKAEDYLYNFSHKFGGSQLYYRVQVMLKDSEASSTQLADTLDRSFQRKEMVFNANTGKDNNVQREFLEIAISDAIDPAIIGFLVNHQYELFSSEPWKEMIKQAVQDKYMGFSHKAVYVPNSMQEALPKTKFWSHKKVIQIETDWKVMMKEKTNIKLRNLFKNPILGCFMEFV